MIMKPEEVTNYASQPTKSPTVLDGFIQPGFPVAKVFTCFFLNNCLVFVKSGSFGTNIASTMRASQGGYTSTGLITGAIGGIFDLFNDENRIKKASEVAGYSPKNMVATHKRNFMLTNEHIKSVKIKGPNFAGEIRIIIDADKTHKFRIDRQSKESAKYIEHVFNEFFPGKIQKK